MDAAGCKILVVANETVRGRPLHEKIVELAGEGDCEVLLVCPALNSRIRHWFSDNDAARVGAEDRLESSLAALSEAGLHARGVVGDADPVQAIADALRDFGADQIVISTHPPDRSHWLEKGVVERARALGDLPVTHVVVDMTQESQVVGPPAA